MKSAHKLAAALAVLVMLLVTAYFILTALLAVPGHGRNPISAIPTEPSTPAAAAAAAATTTASPTNRPEPANQGGRLASSAPNEQLHVGPLETARPINVETVATMAKDSSAPPAHMIQAVQAETRPKTELTEEPHQSAPSSSEQLDSSSSQGSESSESSSTTSEPVASETGQSTSNEAESSASSGATAASVEATSTSSTTTTSVPPTPLEHTSNTKAADGEHVASGLLDTVQLYREATTMRPYESFQMSPEENEAWENFKRQYGRAYANSDEERRRAEVFAGNLRFINGYNRKARSSFQLGVNKFADLHRDEINALFIGPTTEWAATLGRSGTSPPPMRILNDDEGAQSGADTARSADWRNLTASEPPDQGTCKESSLFAVVANLEAAINAAARGNSERIKLSETQLIDCFAYSAPPPPGWPPVCAGHLSMVHVLEFLQRQAIRLVSQDEYGAFKAAQAQGRAPPQTCVPPPPLGAPDQPDNRPKVGSYVSLHRDNIEEALLNRGPLVVALDASQPTFHFYKSGIYHEHQCSSDTYNMHALLVGYAPAGSDGDTSQAHFTLRASLGPHWGELGHMRLLKDGERNKCLPQHLATYANLAYE